MVESQLTLTSTEFLILAIGIMVSMLAGVSALYWVIKGDKESTKKLLQNDFLVRMITIISIISAAGMLALAGRLDSEVATILSGVAGFILGGSNMKQQGSSSSRANDNE